MTICGHAIYSGPNRLVKSRGSVRALARVWVRDSRVVTTDDCTAPSSTIERMRRCAAAERARRCILCDLVYEKETSRATQQTYWTRPPGGALGRGGQRASPRGA